MKWSLGYYCGEVSCYVARVLYVDANATDWPHNGSNWCNAFTGLHEALEVARPFEIIGVADGVYTPDPEGLGDPREATFQLVDGVTVEGGYSGCGAEEPDERSIRSNLTILSGDLNSDDGPDFSNNDENAYHVVTASETGPTTLLDGVIVTGGNSNRTPSEASSDGAGGGILILGGGPTIRRCTILGNVATGVSSVWAGAGMAIVDSDPTVTSCVFTGNAAVGGFSLGGAAVAYGESDPVFRNCAVTDNSAGGDRWDCKSRQPYVNQLHLLGQHGHLSR